MGRGKLGMGIEMSGAELFVVSAPSGAGKTTLCRQVCRLTQGLVYSVSHTTRAPRPGEEDGRDYFFVSEEIFRKMAENGEFLEWAKLYNNMYGTSRAWVLEQLQQGNDVIMDVDIQGARQIRAGDLPCHLIFVLPPSWDTLRLRLANRGTDSRQEVEMRLGWAEKELQVWEMFDYLIVNDELKEAVEELRSVVVAQRCRKERRGQWVRSHWKVLIPGGR